MTDGELIDRYLRAGDGGAFGELVKRHQDLVYSLCYRMVGGADEAEDLTQEIFIRLIDKVGLWRGEAKFTTWLYRLAVNHCRDHLRRRRPEVVDADEFLVDSGPGPEGQAEAGDLRNRVEAALMALPLDWRSVVWLRDIEGFSYQEIAEILEVELGTVKSRLARARAALASALEGAEAEGGVREQIGPLDHQRG